MKKVDLLKEISAERARLSSFIERIPPTQRETDSISGDMTLKDILFHIHWYEEEIISVLQRWVFEGSPLWELPIDDRNTQINQMHQPLTWGEVEGPFNTVLDRLIPLIEELDEKVLNNPAHFENLPAEWQPWKIIAGNTCDHYRDHNENIEAYLKEKRL